MSAAHPTRRDFVAGATAVGCVGTGAAAADDPPGPPDRPFLTPAADFRDVSRGNPKPHTLRGAAQEAARLTPATWRLEVTADPFVEEPHTKVPATLYRGFHNNDPRQVFQSSVDYAHAMETPPGELPVFPGCRRCWLRSGRRAPPSTGDMAGSGPGPRPSCSSGQSRTVPPLKPLPSFGLTVRRTGVTPVFPVANRFL